jgi:hypothetical protein
MTLQQDSAPDGEGLGSFPQEAEIPTEQAGKPVPRWRTYEVSVVGFDRFTVSSTSHSKARYEAFQRFSEPYPDVTFGQFARQCGVRVCDVPVRDGYDYVRRCYGVDPKVGQRVRLINENSSSGQEGVVVYPGTSTASVHVVVDGRDFAVRVHPMNIEPVRQAAVSTAEQPGTSKASEAND